MLRSVSHQHLFCAFAVELSSLAIKSKLTKRSKGFLGLLTSNVETVFMWPVEAKIFLFSLYSLEDRKHLVYIP